MRKFLTLILGILFVFGAAAQNGRNRTAIPVKLDKQIPAKGIHTVLKATKDIPTATPVGMTNYDMQTNDGIAKRLINHGDGTFSTTFIQYHGANMPTAPDRGTGYNYFDGTSWLYTVMSGNPRIEGAMKTGWPALVALDNGTEVVVNHFNATGGYFGWVQNIGASGTSWTQQNASASQALLWPRAASSGNVIHTFGVVDQGIVYNNQSPAPVYMRSTDGGVSWGGLVQPDGIGSDYFDGISGDSYNIDANGDVVAIVCFDLLSDFVLFKSIDGGDTWTKTIIADSPSDLYDWGAGIIIDADGDAIADTCTTVNNADLVVDDAGVVHIAFSTILILDEDAGDDAASYFYGYNNYIHYWNDNMAAGVFTEVSSPSFHELHISPEAELYIGWTPDADGSGILGDGITGTGDYGFQGWCGFPSIALDASNNVYISYSATMEGDEYLKTDAFPEPQNYKHIHISQKIDGVWSDPIDVTTVDGANSENVYCTLAKKVDTNVYLQYQYDSEPGSSLREDAGEPITDNYILFKAIPVPILPASVESLNNNVKLTVYPNPTVDMITITAQNVNKVEIYNILGEKVYSAANVETVNLEKFSAGAYILKVYTNEGVATKKIQKI